MKITKSNIQKIILAGLVAILLVILLLLGQMSNLFQLNSIFYDLAYLSHTVFADVSPLVVYALLFVIGFLVMFIIFQKLLKLKGDKLYGVSWLTSIVSPILATYLYGLWRDVQNLKCTGLFDSLETEKCIFHAHLEVTIFILPLLISASVMTVLVYLATKLLSRYKIKKSS